MNRLTGRIGQITRVLSCPLGAGHRTNATSVRNVWFVRIAQPRDLSVLVVDYRHGAVLERIPVDPAL